MKKEETVVRVPPALFSYNPEDNTFTLLHRDESCFQSDLIRQKIKIDPSARKGYLHTDSKIHSCEEQQAVLASLKVPPHAFTEFYGYALRYSDYFPLTTRDTMRGNERAVRVEV